MLLLKLQWGSTHTSRIAYIQLIFYPICIIHTISAISSAGVESTYCLEAEFVLDIIVAQGKWRVYVVELQKESSMYSKIKYPRFDMLVAIKKNKNSLAASIASTVYKVL